jgi:hypothetical protein
LAEINWTSTGVLDMTNDEGRKRALGFEPFLHCLEIKPQPHAAYVDRRNRQTTFPQLVGDTDLAEFAGCSMAGATHPRSSGERGSSAPASCG